MTHQVSKVEAALSDRARIAVRVASVQDSGALAHSKETDASPSGLLDSLRHHLLAGETHYPARPGMTELRSRVDERLVELGLPSRGADGVLITASEGESLFVTLLGLGLFPGGSLIGSSDGTHQALLDWMGVSIGARSEPNAIAVARFRQVGVPAQEPTPGDGIPSIFAIADALFGEGVPPLDAGEIIIGSFRGLAEMSSFGLGFVAAEPDILQRITSWKQASSICSPAPAQRAALWALGVRP